MHCCCINFANESVGIERFFYFLLPLAKITSLTLVMDLNFSHSTLTFATAGFRLKAANSPRPAEFRQKLTV